MSIIVKDSGGGTFTPHPAGGHFGVCVDVHDLGIVETQWGAKRKVDIYFYCGIDKHDENGNLVEDDHGNPVHLFVRSRFTPTLHEAGNLRPFLERWRGKPFTPAELEGFDLEKLIGAPAQLEIVHNESNGNTYANIDYIKKAPAGSDVPAIPDDYIRFCDRPDPEDEGIVQSVTGSGSPFDEGADDLPF